MNPTLKDVAEKAGVSRSAVSRTFTKGASVSQRMRVKVEAAAIELGYSPNALASSLTTGRTKLVGLIANNFQNPLFLEVFDLFTKRLQTEGLRPLLVNLSEENKPAESVRMMRQYSVDGVVVASSTLSPDFAKAFRDGGLPVVHSFGRATADPAVHTVGIDNVDCGRMAARELLARGYKNIAFLGGPKTATSTQDRLAGFLRVVRSELDISYSVSFASSYSYQSGYDEMHRVLNDNRAEAYFCGDDVIAVGALSALRDHDLQVPSDVGLIGLNDMEMASWRNINLTTIRQPIEEIVESSVDLMVSMLNDPLRPPERRLFSCLVVERGTLKKRRNS
jgi:DNA-binding LacI/PurR family transcriptional regulator